MGFSTVVVAQQPGLQKEFDYLFGSTSDNSFIKTDSSFAEGKAYSFKTGQWGIEPIIEENINLNLPIAIFEVDREVPLITKKFTKSELSGHSVVLRNTEDFEIAGLSVEGGPVTIKGGGKFTLNESDQTHDTVLSTTVRDGEDPGLTIDALGDSVHVDGGKTAGIGAYGGNLAINAGMLTVNSYTSGLPKTLLGNGSILVSESGHITIDAYGPPASPNYYNLEINNITSCPEHLGYCGSAGIRVASGGGVVDVKAEKMKIQSLVALFASGFPGQNGSFSGSEINIRSGRADIYGDVLSVGKASVNLASAYSTYNIKGDLIAGRHEIAEPLNTEKLGSKYEGRLWVYEAPVAGRINLGGDKSTLIGNAIAGYGGIINIELNNGQWTGMGANYSDYIRADVQYDNNWKPKPHPEPFYQTDGKLNVALNGSNAVWNVTRDSRVNELTMKDLGVLNLAYESPQKATPYGIYHQVSTGVLVGPNSIGAAANGIVRFRTDLGGGTDLHPSTDQLIVRDKATGTYQATIAISGSTDLNHSKDWLIEQGWSSLTSFTNEKGTNEFSGRGMVTVWCLGFVPKGENPDTFTPLIEGKGEGNWYLYKPEAFQPNPGEQKPEKPDPDKPNPDKPTPDKPSPDKPIPDNPAPLPDEIVENLSIGTSATQALAYQADLDDLRTRLGEVRYGAQDGAWVKAFTKKEKIGEGSALEQEVNGINVGLDTLVAAQEGSAWLVGGAFRYSNADQEGVALKHVSGELDEYSLKAYATWMHDEGSYADFVVQAGRYKQSLNGLDNTATGSSNAKYRTWGYGASVEVGHMFSFANDADDSQWTDHWFVEPQLQLAYFHAKGADYHTSTGLKVDQGDADFLMGRAGVALGKKFNFGDANSLDHRYFQVSAIGGVKHDFIGGDQTIRYTGVDKASVSVKADELDDTRFYYGVNFDWQLANNWRVYGQVSREEGDQYTKDYDFSLGLKYAF